MHVMAILPFYHAGPRATQVIRLGNRSHLAASDLAFFFFFLNILVPDGRYLGLVNRS